MIRPDCDDDESRPDVALLTRLFVRERHWGSGLAQQLHAVGVAAMAAHGSRRAACSSPAATPAPGRSTRARAGSRRASSRRPGSSGWGWRCTCCWDSGGRGRKGVGVALDRPAGAGSGRGQRAAGAVAAIDGLWHRDRFEQHHRGAGDPEVAGRALRRGWVDLSLSGYGNSTHPVKGVLVEHRAWTAVTKSSMAPNTPYVRGRDATNAQPRRGSPGAGVLAASRGTASLIARFACTGCAAANRAVPKRAATADVGLTPHGRVKATFNAAEPGGPSAPRGPATLPSSMQFAGATTIAGRRARKRPAARTYEPCAQSATPGASPRAKPGC